jgi:hypothetical protein
MTLDEAAKIAMECPPRTRMAVAAWTLDSLRRSWRAKGTYRHLIFAQLGLDPSDEDWDGSLPDRIASSWMRAAWS